MHLVKIVMERVNEHCQEFVVRDILDLISADYLLLTEYWRNKRILTDTTS